MSSFRSLSLSAALAVSLVGSQALADGWPLSVAGNWSVQGNQHAGVLSITQYPGAAGSLCKPIRGTIYGVDAVEGFYCPYSGRIAFQRYINLTLNPKQFWSGNLSQVVAGQPLRIGGLFASFDHNNTSGTSGGSLGEYNFSATK
jgi:hypothetical protein